SIDALPKRFSLHRKVDLGRKYEARAIGANTERNTEWLTAIQTEKTLCRRGNPGKTPTRRNDHDPSPEPGATRSCVKCRCPRALERSSVSRPVRPMAMRFR